MKNKGKVKNLQKFVSELNIESSKKKFHSENSIDKFCDLQELAPKEIEHKKSKDIPFSVTTKSTSTTLNHDIKFMLGQLAKIRKQETSKFALKFGKPMTEPNSPKLSDDSDDLSRDENAENTLLSKFYNNKNKQPERNCNVFINEALDEQEKNDNLFVKMEDVAPAKSGK